MVLKRYSSNNFFLKYLIACLQRVKFLLFENVYDKCFDNVTGTLNIWHVMFWDIAHFFFRIFFIIFRTRHSHLLFASKRWWKAMIMTSDNNLNRIIYILFQKRCIIRLIKGSGRPPDVINYTIHSSFSGLVGDLPMPAPL